MSMENSERSAFIGVHVKPTTKRALETLVAQKGVVKNGKANLSRFINDLIEAALKQAAESGTARVVK